MCILEAVRNTFPVGRVSPPKRMKFQTAFVPQPLIFGKS